MNHSESRPTLPGSTPAPGPAGLRNVYASKSPPHPPTETGSRTQFHAASTNKNNQRALLEKTVNKIVNKLPFQLRESVTAVITMAMTSAENVQKDLDICYHEIAVLRNDLNKKTTESAILKKHCTLYEERVRGLEENVAVLRDNVDSRQKFSIKNKSAMTRLSSTNRMLIDALDALQANTNPNVLMASKSAGNLDIADRDRPGLLVPISKKVAKDAQQQDYEETEKKFSMFQNDKLRESLLRVAREHYRSMKNSELLDAKVVELRASLRAQEQANRKLKSELDEVKILLNADGGGAAVDPTPQVESTNVRSFQFGALDTKFKGLIDRNAFDPIDGIQLLRRIMSHAATAPSNLNLHATILHLASRDVLKMFECDMVCLFIKDPVRDNILLRYTVKSPLSEEVNTVETTCVAAEVIKTGKVARINVVANSALFNPLVDCCTGVIVKRMMSLPIYDADTNRVFGCINIINKSKNDLFSEIDEIFGLLFADQASLLVTSCMRYDGMALHATMLQHLLEASTAVFSVIPDKDSLVSTRPLQPEQILSTLEMLSREILKCPTTRAFLVSEFAGLPPGELVLLEHVTKPKALSIETCITMPLHSGIAGHVIETGMMYKLENDKFDPYINPLVDIDPLDLPMITVPIVDLHGTVVGCLQLIVGPRSPKLRESEDAKSQQGLLFVQAAQWLTHQIAAPLQYLIKFIGNTVNRPLSTPSNFVSRGPKPDFFINGLENMMLTGGEPQEHLRPLTSPSGDFVAVMGGGDTSEKPFSSQNNRVTFSKDTAAAMEALKAERDSLLQDIAESRGEVAGLFDKLSEAEAAAGTAKVAHSELQQVIATMEVDMAALRGELEAKSANDGVAALLESALAEKSTLEASVTQAWEELSALRAAHESADAELLEAREQIASQMRQIENLEAYAATHHRSDEEGEAADAAKAETSASGAAESQSSFEEQIANACAAVREEVTKEWKESYEALEQSYNSYKSYSETAEAENESLKGNVTTLQSEIDALKASSALHQSENEKATLEIAELKEQVAKLTATVAQKENIQSILQAQVARMAGENLKEIDMALASATSTSTKVPSTTPIPVSASASASAPMTAAAKADTARPTSAEATAATGTGSSARPPSNPPTPSPGSRRPSGRPPSRPPSGTRITAAPIKTDTAGASIADAPPGANTAPDLASLGWTEHVDEFQRTYYYNEATGESSWANPALGEIKRGEWVQTYDESGSMYWVHQVTGESAWDVTEEGEPVESGGADLENDEDESPGPMGGGGGIYDTVNSQYSATAGDYTIEL